MIVRAIDVNGDWTFGKGKNNYLSGKDALAQLITTRLRSFLGDCFFDTTAGIDWFNILGAKDELAVDIAVSTVIKNTPGVTALTRLSIVLDVKRNLRIVYTVDTVFAQATAIEQITGVVDFLLTESGSILTTEGGSGLVI